MLIRFFFVDTLLGLGTYTGDDERRRDDIEKKLESVQEIDKFLVTVNGQSPRLSDNEKRIFKSYERCPFSIEKNSRDVC